MLSYAFLFLIQATVSIDNGLGVNPPMGWRSWNYFHRYINQPLIEKVIDAMIDTSREVNNEAASYYDLGYTEVGVDDNWQYCLENATNPGHYFHSDKEPHGWPIVNSASFPDLEGLVEYAHYRKVRIGWYMANCICSEHNKYPANEVNDVAFLRQYDFDAIKLDGCSSSINISNWQSLINSTGKPLITENCHNQPNYPTDDWCPFNFFRSSGDINSDYTRIIGNNLQSVIPYSKYPKALTRQGCFAYPDMLEVGNIPAIYNATQYSMDRTHFGAWVVVSSPLILGYDVTNSDTTDRVWDILTNTEAIAVSQTWEGHPGTLLAESEEKVYYEYPQHIKERVKRDNEKYKSVPTVAKESVEGVKVSLYQIWGKPQANGAWAVLLMNNDGYNVVDLIFNFSVIPNFNVWVQGAKLRSIWDKKDLGTFSNSYTATNVLPFDSEFILITPL